MLTQSFIFLEHIGKKKERIIQKQVKDWYGFLKAKSIKGIAPLKKQQYDRMIIQAIQALKKEESSFFKRTFPTTAQWRLYSQFKEDCCFLDCEVNSYGKIVVLGIADSRAMHHFVLGVNLEKENILQGLSKYKLVVTFNGGTFDLPKLQKQFGVTLTIPHIDLKPLCVQIGWKGGLKEVEKLLTIKRPQHLYGNPVTLWKAFHASGDREYLNLLLAYNSEDCENLERIMRKVYHHYAHTFLNS